MCIHPTKMPRVADRQMSPGSEISANSDGDDLNFGLNKRAVMAAADSAELVSRAARCEPREVITGIEGTEDVSGLPATMHKQSLRNSSCKHM